MNLSFWRNKFAPIHGLRAAPLNNKVSNAQSKFLLRKWRLKEGMRWKRGSRSVFCCWCAIAPCRLLTMLLCWAEMSSLLLACPGPSVIILPDYCHETQQIFSNKILASRPLLAEGLIIPGHVWQLLWVVRTAGTSLPGIRVHNIVNLSHIFYYSQI